MRPNPQFPAGLVTFTDEILNGKLHFLFSESIALFFGQWIYQKAFLNWLFQYLSFLNTFFNRFCTVENWGVDPHYLYRNSLTLRSTLSFFPAKEITLLYLHVASILIPIKHPQLFRNSVWDKINAMTTHSTINF